MFSTILISVCTFMHVYVFWRIASVPFIKHHVSGKVLIGSGIVLWAILVSSRVVWHSRSGIIAEIFELLGMNWLAVLFLIFLPLLITDILTLWGTLFPSLASSLRGWALFIGLLLSLVATVQGLRPPTVENHDVVLAGLPDNLDGTVIIALSDMHLGSLIGKKWQEKRMAQVRAQQPDLVVLLGDIFEGHSPDETAFAESFKKLSPPYGLWAVPGNHEFYAGNIMTHLESENFRVLTNKWVEIKPGLILAGVEDLTVAGWIYPQKDPIALSLAGRPPGATILLSHSPLQMENAARNGVGLMLSGHTHAGQIWPFGYLVKLRYPIIEGLHHINGMNLIVGRGTGTWGPRMRLWKTGQILRITLKSPEKR
ncbi:MAG: metallophosphoesterase [Proteobacteria bacterium]|nr:metallophosphoesterase [Pseudomonadota bacterium]MBU1386862.1 metallophosphoesterase [Pseudomonadota bacterium]MBU1541429.1 metallophosphoesterase [Pseudomonadota bacterium]MBU2429422.1 metallophosphoesterase [Pseudomonadota bacterium]MBU2480039.1 metallophosphoesterase [Pseudomonadota bacterium]